MNTDQFISTYGKQLNPQQLEAIQTVNGPVLLLAVPGSGKTTVLVTRLGYMLCCYEIDPRQILTLTYTVAATKDMADRFSNIFGQELGKNLEFRTINGICAKIIQQYGRMIGKAPFELISDEKLIGKIIADIYREHLGEYPTESDIKGVRTLITYSKNMMLTMEEMEQLEKETSLPLAAIFKEYNHELKRRSLMDYDDQMIYAYKMLKLSPELLKQYQEKYRYICVDEAQDTSKVQHAIISLLAGTTGNLFMVGDEDQSIYGFRAAYPEALLNFEKDHPGAKVLLMEQNYRSNAKIVAVADQFIQKNQMRHKKRMVAARGSMEDIRYIDVKSRKSQYTYLLKVASDCQTNTAVLYRDNESVLPLIDLLERQNISYRIKNADLAFFTNRVVVDITNIMKLAFMPDDTELFMQIYYKIQMYLKKDQAISLCNLAAERGISVLEAIELAPFLDGLEVRNCKAIRTHLLNMRSETPYKALNRIVKFMGYGDYLERNKMNENKVSILKMLAANEDTIPDFLNRLAQLQTLIREKEVDWNSNFILSTIHSSKGLEYDEVYLIDVCDGVFPEKVIKNYRAASEEECRNYEEERRLFYVGMTRAKDKLSIFCLKERASSFIGEISPVTESEKKAALGQKKVATRSGLAAPSYYQKTSGKQKAASSVPEIDLGDRVKIRLYGEGVITVLDLSDDGRIDGFHVEFDECGEKQFKYPAAFECGMKKLAAEK